MKTKQRKASLNEYEARIMKVVHSTHKSLTTAEIAKKAGVSWATAKKYLKSLASKDLVERVKSGIKEV